MSRLKFGLTTDQLELLLAFEDSQGLGQLAETMAKDPSVISRNLQRIAEEYPVLVKSRGRWDLTPLGIQINESTKSYLLKQRELLSGLNQEKVIDRPIFANNSVLIIINAQNGLMDSISGGRNNTDAERNIGKILCHWRANGRKIVHVKHVSENPASAFFRGSIGSEIVTAMAPHPDELVIEKSKSSAFTNTDLEALLNKETNPNILLVGFTANECIDATTRDATALGFSTFVVGDATASFDLRDPGGKLVKAERIHKLTLTNINAFYAKVLNTSEVLR